MKLQYTLFQAVNSMISCALSEALLLYT